VNVEVRKRHNIIELLKALPIFTYVLYPYIVAHISRTVTLAITLTPATDTVC